MAQRPRQTRGMQAGQYSKRYCGIAASPSASAIVLVEDGRTGALLGPLVHRARYSPTGFSWGYDGAGPRDLARSLLAAVLGDEARCQACAGRGGTCGSCTDGLRRDLPDVELVREVIAQLGREWVLDEPQLRAWWNARQGGTSP